MTTATLEQSVAEIMKQLDVTERQAKAGLRWVEAMKTRSMGKNEVVSEMLSEAQHNLKQDWAFPERKPRLEFMSQLKQLYHLDQ